MGHFLEAFQGPLAVSTLADVGLTVATPDRAC